MSRRLFVAALAVTLPLLTGYSAAAAPAPGPIPTPTRIADTIAQENGTLIPALAAAGGRQQGQTMVMPDGTEVSLAPAALSDCASGAVCLWSEASYTGRMVSVRGAGARVNMGSYSFNDQMTSWANRTTTDARWFYDGIESGTGRCMNPGEASANVGATDNDRMSALSIYTNSTTC